MREFRIRTRVQQGRTGLHWKNDPTQEKLPLLLIFSLRSEALHQAAGAGDTSALVQWLAGLKRDLTVTDLSLGPLTVDQTGQLLQILEGPIGMWTISVGAGGY